MYILPNFHTKLKYPGYNILACVLDCPAETLETLEILQVQLQTDQGKDDMWSWWKWDESDWQGSEEIRRGALPPGLEVPPRMRGLRRVLCWYIVGLCYRAPGQEESKELGIVTSQSLFLYALHPVLANNLNTRLSLSPRRHARLQNSSWLLWWGRAQAGPRWSPGRTQVITKQVDSP